MTLTRTIAAALIALAAVSASPASAGVVIDFGFGGPYWGQYHGRLSASEIGWLLRQRNYHHINFIDWHGSTYELTARKNGRDYIVVSAWSGNIIRRQSI